MSTGPTIFEVGATVGDYQIISVIGRGGMGKVYKVRNILSDRIEAMKLLLPDVEAAPRSDGTIPSRNQSCRLA